MRTKYGIAAMALAIVCLLAASAYAYPSQGYGLSDPCQRDCFNGPYGKMWMLLVDDATRDDLQNMTLSEIDDLREQRMQEFENMTLAQLNETRLGRMGKMGHGMMSQDMMDQDMIGRGRGGYR